MMAAWTRQDPKDNYKVTVRQELWNMLDPVAINLLLDKDNKSLNNNILSEHQPAGRALKE